jgi:hypothetical protein
MATLLEQALEELKAMPAGAQEAIAYDSLELIRSERKWDELFADARSEALFEKMKKSSCGHRRRAGHPRRSIGFERSVNSQTTADFWKRFSRLLVDEQDQAREICRLWRANPSHNSLHFERVSRHPPIYSVRIGLGYWALCLRDGDTVTWYWVGTHAEYDRMLRQRSMTCTPVSGC